MKRTFKFLVAVAAVAFAASCGNNNPIDQGPAVATVLEVAPAELSFAAEGAQPATVEVTSDGSWVVVNSNDWLSVDPKSGDGNGTLTVTVADNKSGSEVLAPRSAEFSIVATDKLSKTVKVAQEGDSERLVEAVPYHIDFTEGQGTWTIVDVEMSEALTYVWSQTSNYGMKASAFVNSTNQPSVSLLCSPIFDLTAQSVAILSFTHARKYGNLDQLSVVAKKTTDADWTTLEVANWPDGGSWDFIDSGEIDLSAFCGSKIQIAFRYTSSDSAAATWEIKTFDLTNDASPKLGVSTEEIEVEATETSASFNVTGNVNWTAVASEGASVEPAQGKGGATLTVSFPVNTNTESGAEYTVTVSTTEEAEVKSYEVVIKQAAFVNNYKTYTTLAEIQEAVYGGETQFYMDIDWIDVTMVSNVNVFAEDRTAGILFYKTGLESSLQAGMRIKGKILATASVYNNLPEITAVYVEEGATSTDWNSSWPCTSLTIEQLVADYNKYINRKVKIDGVFVNDGWSSSDRNGVIAQGENTINVYVQGNQEVVETGCEGNIVCWPTYYKETKQVGFWPNPDAAKTFFTVTKEPSHPENVDLSVSEWRIPNPEIDGAFTEFKFTSATELLYGEGDAEDGFWEDEAYPGTYTYDGNELAISIDLDGDVIELTATIDGNSMTFTSGAYEGLVFTKYEGESVSIANTPETAYTATEAIALYDAGEDLETPVYVKGKVSKILTSDANFEKYHNLDIMVVDESGAEFEFYRMKDIDNADFTENYIKVGDDLVAYGTLAKYNTTYEIKNCYLVSRVPAAPSENVELEGTYWSNGQTGEDLMALEFANSKVIPTLYGSPYDAMDYTVEGNVVVFGGYYMGTVSGDSMAVTYMGQDLCTLTKGEKPAQTKTYTTFAEAQAAILAGETEFILDLAELAEFTYKNADGKSTYAQDATGGMLFYNTGIESWAYSGLRFKGGALKCTAAMFRGNPQITAVESWAGITKDYSAKYPCHTITLSELLTNFDKYINCKVKINGVTVTDGWGGSDRNGEIKLGDDVLAVYQKVSGNEQGAETGCEGNIVAWPTINNSDKQLAFWAHPEYPTKKFFEVTKAAPAAYPQSLAETSWRQGDESGYALVSFVDAQNAFMVNGDEEGPWWEEIMEFTYTYDATTGTGAVQGNLATFAFNNDGNIVLKMANGGEGEFSPVDFVAKPESTPTYTTLAEVQAAILANAGTGEYKFIMDLAELAEITYKNGSSVFAQDATGGVLFYGTGAEGWVYGGLRFKGGALECTAKIYNGVPEITAVASWANVVKDYDSKWPCINVTLSDLLANYDRYLNCKVKISGVTVEDGWGGSDRNGVIAVGADKLNVYQQVRDNEQGAVTGCEGNIIAWPTYYKENKQLGFWPHAEYPTKKFFEVTKEAPAPGPDPVDLSPSEWRIDFAEMGDPEGAGEGFALKFSSLTAVAYSNYDANGYDASTEATGTYFFDGETVTIDLGIAPPTAGGQRRAEAEKWVATVSGDKMTFISGQPEGLVFTKYEEDSNPGTTKETYASNVEWTLVNKAYADKATVNEVADVNVLKLGTSSVNGQATVVIPAGSTSVSFYGVAWRGVTDGSVKFSAAGGFEQTVSLSGNEGATGNAPYTMTVADSDKYTVTLPMALPADTTVTIDGNKRVILFGIQAK